MDSGRWQRVAQLYDLVIERDPSERAAFLDGLSDPDAELRPEVESLLRQESESLLIDEPMLETAADVLDKFDFESGSRLGAYLIDSPIGHGGMGQVYRATDIRVNRTVAIKVLPRAAARDAKSRARFDREAHALASLSHPHICALYDVTQHEGADVLVMEYVDGDTLATRLEQGPLPLDIALSLAIDIADALAAAHARGIVHRDVKPANIILTSEGAKLVDFGLARPTASVAAEGARPGPAMASSLTTEGAILGTFQYMAPEQLEGHEPEARTDIFALGAVLYEMLSGEKAFQGSSQASVIGAIMHAEPPPVSVRSSLAPAALDRVVATCVAKSPDERWQCARDLARELQRIRRDPEIRAVVRESKREWLPWSLALVLGLAAAALAIVHLRESPPRQLPTRFAVSAPSGALLRPPFSPQISPDGRLLAFMAVRGGEQVLAVRRVDALDAQVLAGTEGGRFPFWSPDSRAIGFFADGRLKKVSASGGPVQTVGKAEAPLGGAWNRDGVILFSSRDGVVYRLSPGDVQPSAQISVHAGEQLQSRPQFLPDGRRFLYFVRPNAAYVATLDGGPPIRAPVSTPVALYSPPGYLVFPQDRSLVAQQFNSTLTKAIGSPVPLADNVVTGPPAGSAAVPGGSAFSVSDNGVLAYAASPRRSLAVASVERSGRPLGTIRPFPFDAAAGSIELSPAGTQLAMQSRRGPDPDSEIWLFDLVNGRSTQLTFSPGADRRPIWSPDGSRVAFVSRRPDAPGLYRKAADGHEPEELLLRSPSPEWDQYWPTDWSSKGIVYETGRDPANVELWMLPVDGDRKPYPLLHDAGDHHAPRISPDGEWLAYETSLGTGPRDVVIQSVRTPGVKLRITTGGGSLPRWRVDGKELFYVTPDGRVVAVAIATGRRNELHLGAAQSLFQTRLTPDEVPSINVSPDGQRFFIASSDPDAAPSIIILTNWWSVLTR